MKQYSIVSMPMPKISKNMLATQNESRKQRNKGAIMPPMLLLSTVYTMAR